MGLRLLKILNNIFSWVVILCIVLVLCYCGYAIWDNNSVYGETLDLHVKIRELKPDDAHLSFEELLKINPDTVAWIELDGTEIDDPIVQGKDNLEYLNKDIYGNYSLAGTLYLDSRCARDFSDAYSLVYGHHMERHEMFGDLDLYLEESFFNENSTGELTVPGMKYPLQILACMTVDSTDEWVFQPQRADQDIIGFLNYCWKSSNFVRNSVLSEVENQPENYRVVTLSTCSSEVESDRTIIVTAYRKTGG